MSNFIHRLRVALAIALMLWLTTAGATWADAPPAGKAASGTPWYAFNWQATGIDQQLFPFRSPYQGTNSFHAANENALSHTYTLYLGLRALPGLELYLNPEMARGTGISSTIGLAGFTNGDVIRNPDVGQSPYLARWFVRYILPLTSDREDVKPGENLIAGPQPTSRLQFTAGKLGSNDIFDVNGYANSTRTQFENWALINNAAYDYAADTRGYTIGLALEWIHPEWTLRAGTFQMPTVANGPIFDNDILHAHGDQIELELHEALIPNEPAVIRLLGYMNHAHMGTYREAIAAAPPGLAPDITQTRKVGNIKYGFGINLEQPLADDGDTGAFARFGWDDGATETFAFTEADLALSAGGQLSGAHWGRAKDRLALALAINGLSSAHSEYMGRGGLGFILGDGKLNYAPETIIEAYYSWQAIDWLAVSLGYQWIGNPGYNQDRGPASVLSLRLHLED